MHNTNTRRGNTQIKTVILNLFQDLHLRRGFTLIELLVVVLIIGILAAVAVPQYQVAVKKAELTKYISLVKALVTAEDAYLLANGEYTTDLTSLDIDLPTEGCSFVQLSGKQRQGRYNCQIDNKTITYGVFNGPTNAQAGDRNLRYVYFFDSSKNFEYDDNVRRGDIFCFSFGEIARNACKTLGDGTEIKGDGTNWDYIYKLQ